MDRAVAPEAAVGEAVEATPEAEEEAEIIILVVADAEEEAARKDRDKTACRGDCSSLSEGASTLCTTP